MKATAKFYVNTIRRIISLVMNAIYAIRYVCNSKKRTKINIEIERLKLEIKTINDVEKELKKFKWVADPLGGLIDYSPNIITFLYRNKEDDCDGAAFYTKYLFDLIGLETIVYSLVSKKPFLAASHVVALTKRPDGDYKLYSNGQPMGIYKSLYQALQEAIKKYADYCNITYYPFWIKIK